MKDKWNKKWMNQRIEEMDEAYFRSHFIGNPPPLIDGVPCSHKGCLNHLSHPCEVCGRIAANSQMTRAYYER